MFDSKILFLIKIEGPTVQVYTNLFEKWFSILYLD